MSLGAANLVAELKRRRVFRVLVGYGIVSFAVLQIVEPIMHALHLLDAVLTYTVVALALGFPVAIVLAWAFDINEGRIERTGPAASAALKGARLPLLLVAIGVVAAAPGVVWYLVLRAHPKVAQEPAASSTAVPSIAVLPLVNMSRDPWSTTWAASTSLTATWSARVRPSTANSSSPAAPPAVAIFGRSTC